MDSDDDANLVARVLAGDKSAYGVLIDRHRADAVAFARRLVSRADAEDVVQDALISAFLAMGSLRAPERFKSWLLGIVINLCRTRLRLRREGYFDDRYGGRAMAGFRLEDAAPSAELIQETRELHRMITDAVGTLPSEMQEMVRLHYVEGLKLGEIAVLLEVPLGTVKARIHRARERLRVALESEIGLGPNRERKGGDSMIEVTVDDVVVRSPKNEEVKWLAEGKDYKLGFTRVILLKERAGNRVLPIWVGAGEGDIIAMLLANIAVARPTPWDLTARLLEVGEMKIEKVAVIALRGITFIATMWINAHGKISEVDARPSDAITLALRAGVSIFVTPEAFEQAAPYVLTVDREVPELEAIHQKLIAEGKAESDATEMEWRSVRSLPRADSPWIKTQA
jgi:RNA polymerase sigma factor (sigma-70 family)